MCSIEQIKAIERQNDNDKILSFIKREAFNNENSMDLIYQIFRICLYKSKHDNRFSKLKQEIIDYYQNL